MSNLIKLTDNFGRDVYFEFLDLISWNNDNFVVLLPVESEDGEVVILRLASINDEAESYVSVEDDGVLLTVYSLFQDN